MKKFDDLFSRKVEDIDWSQYPSDIDRETIEKMRRKGNADVDDVISIFRKLIENASNKGEENSTIDNKKGSRLSKSDGFDWLRKLN